jgi:hypothetical protein
LLNGSSLLVKSGAVFVSGERLSNT